MGKKYYSVIAKEELNIDTLPKYLWELEGGSWDRKEMENEIKEMVEPMREYQILVTDSDDQDVLNTAIDNFNGFCQNRKTWRGSPYWE